MTIARELVSYITQTVTHTNGLPISIGVVTFLSNKFANSNSNFEWGTPVAEHRFNPEFLTQFSTIMDKVEADTSLVGLIVTGEGKYFSNGVDISYVKAYPEAPNALQKQVEVLMARILTLNMLTVCVMNGHTTAAGALLSLAFDYRYMHQRGFFFLPAVDLGIVYSQGFIELVKAKVPDVRTQRDLMIVSKRYTSSELLDLGIIDKICGSGLDEAVVFLQSNAKRNKASLGEIKKRIYSTAYDTLTSETVSNMFWGALFAKL